MHAQAPVCATALDADEGPIGHRRPLRVLAVAVDAGMVGVPLVLDASEKLFGLGPRTHRAGHGAR